MTWPPCGDPACPVARPTPLLLRSVRTHVLRAGGTWWRGTRDDPEVLSTATAGPSRFGPLPDTEHAYFGASRTVALLESALHEASGPDPTIYLSRLAGWRVEEVRLTVDLRVADLRDAQLDRIHLDRAALVDTTPRHYGCTRTWAGHLQRQRPGGHQLTGIIWHSRQADLHRRSQTGGLLADVLVHSPSAVAVVWHPHGPAHPFEATGRHLDLVEDGRPARLLRELSALIAAPVM